MKSDQCCLLYSRRVEKLDEQRLEHSSLIMGDGNTDHIIIVLALYLSALHFSDSSIGLFMTLTLVGDLFISVLLT